MQKTNDSSSSSRDWKYDVFLNFRGEDTRRNFVSYLHYCLELKGIRAFNDDNLLATGKSILDQFFEAIEDSRFAVVIFSKNFAYSTFCLDELAHIIKCKNELGMRVIPIFYDVDHSDVRRQCGSFGESFQRLEEKYGDAGGMEKIQRWRDALAEAANISGFDFQYCGMNGAALIKRLIKRMFPESWKYDVYLSFRVEDVGRTFGSYLYDALVQNGIHTFKNDDKWARMENSDTSVNAIEKSKFAIVIFSKGYAASRCCLEELAHIMRCKNELGLTVIPIFYDVSPSDVGFQNTSFAGSFSQHEERCKDDDDRENIQRWRDAFVKAGKISGHHLQNYKDDVDCIKKVVDFISPKSLKLFPFRKQSLSDY